MADTDPSSEAQNPVPAPVVLPPESRRYLGNGEQSGAARVTVAQLIFSAAALFLLLISLIGISFTFRDQLGDRLLVTGYVLRTSAPEFPPLSYVENDLQRIAEAPDMLRSLQPDGAPLANLLTAADFERLFTEVLPVVSQDTLILTIRCHSATTAAGTFLQPVDADPARPESGVAVHRLLEAVASCPTTNKLLILDIVPFDTNLDLGIPCNLAADQLRADFRSLEESGVNLGNLLILMASDTGQSSGTVYASQHSAFSLFLAYGLNGGPEADSADRNDGIVTASELAGFVSRSVADWSIRFRGPLQHPFSLGTGRDFPIAGVQDLLTLQSWLDRNDAEESAEEDPATAEADSAAPADGAEVNGSAAATTEVSPNDVLAQIHQLWLARDQLRDSPVPTRRPRHWELFARILQRAEYQLLAGDAAAAQKLLTEELAPLQKDIAKPMTDTIQFPWTSAFDDLEETETLKQSRDELQATITEPSLRNLNVIADSPFAEATLTRQLAAVLTTPEQLWSEPQLVATGLELRQLAERTARLTTVTPNSDETPLSTPWLLPFVRDDIEAADRIRVLAEQSLLVQRFGRAAELFRNARRRYTDAAAKCRRVAAQTDQIHLGAMEAAGVLRWLYERPWGPEVPERLSLLNAIMNGIVELSREPREELLTPLLSLIQEMRRAVANDVQNALLQSTTADKRALLNISLLRPDYRLQLLQSLLDANDRPQLRDSLPEFSQSTDRRDSECQTSLNTLYLAMGLRSEAIRSRDTDDLVALDVVQDGEPPLLAQGDQHRPATILRRVLNQLNADPLALPDQAVSGAWEQYIFHLFRSSFQAELLKQTRFQPALTNILLGRMSSEHLVWQLHRLQQNSYAMAGDYTSPRKQIVQSLMHLNPGYQESDATDEDAFTARRTSVNIADNGNWIDVRYLISTGSDLQDTDRGNLVLDWYPQRQVLKVLSVTNMSSSQMAMASAPDTESDSTAADAEPVTADDSESVDHWRLRLPVYELAGGTVDVKLRLAAVDGDVDALIESLAEPLTAWIELADDSTWALPLDLQIKTDQQRAFEIQLATQDSRLEERGVNVFTNETLPVTLSILSRKPEPHDVQIEIHSGDSHIAWPATVTPGPQPVTVPPTEDGQLIITGGQLEVRITQAGEVISRRVIPVAIQNPATSFSPSVSFEPSSGKVTATISRLATSDADTTVTTTMIVDGVQLAEAKLESQLEPGDSATSVDATIVEDPDVTGFTVRLGVAGVPRLFTFDVNALTGDTRQRVSSRVGILSPEDGAVFSVSRDVDSLDMKLQVDSPRDCEVHIGIDRNGNDYLESAERLGGGRFWRGRRVTTRLTAAAESQELSISSSVADLSFPVTTTGVAGRQRVLAQLLTGEQTVAASNTVYFIKATPDVEILTPEPDVPIGFGASITVTVASDPVLFPVIEDVEIGVDRNGNGKWDEDETVAPTEPAGTGTLQFDRQNVTSAIFNSDDLLSEDEQSEEPAPAPQTDQDIMPPKTVMLMARAVRRSSTDQPDEEREARQGEIARRKILLVDPSQLPPETGTVAGLVQTADGLGQRDVVVRLGETTTRTGDEGEFEFADVPIGIYTVVGETPRRAGSVEVEVLAGETADASFQLQLR